MSKNRLKKISAKVCKKLGLKPVIIRELTNKMDFLELFHGFCGIEKRGTVIYMRFKNPQNKKYTSRFLLSLYSHELSHGILKNGWHGKRFKLTQRKIYKIVKRVYEAELFKMQKEVQS